MTFNPKKYRKWPADKILTTVVNIGIHEVTFTTDFRLRNPDMNIIWIPGKPEDAEFLPKFQRTFEHARMQHLQKCADISQRPVTVLTTASLKELKEKVENPKGEE